MDNKHTHLGVALYGEPPNYIRPFCGFLRPWEALGVFKAYWRRRGSGKRVTRHPNPTRSKVTCEACLSVAADAARQNGTLQGCWLCLGTGLFAADARRRKALIECPRCGGAGLRVEAHDKHY